MALTTKRPLDKVKGAEPIGLPTVVEKYKQPMLADFTSMVIYLFSARNFAAPQNKS